MPSSCAAVECESDLDEDEEPLPVHVIVPAAGQPPLKTSAVRTVFELADARLSGRRLSGLPALRPDEPARRFVQALREAGTTRCVGGQYPGDRWTEERAELERVRRAKQRPPRPTKRAPTRGKKLLNLIGSDERD